MPEIPADDWEQFLPTDERDDRFVNVQMPRSALRSMARDAKAYRQAQAAAADAGGDATLESGEADLPGMRHSLGVDSPADHLQPGDPYREMERIVEAEFAAGAQEKQAIGMGLNSLVNAAMRGDQRVIIRRGTPAANG